MPSSMLAILQARPAQMAVTPNARSGGRDSRQQETHSASITATPAPPPCEVADTAVDAASSDAWIFWWQAAADAAPWAEGEALSSMPAPPTAAASRLGLEWWRSGTFHQVPAKSSAAAAATIVACQASSGRPGSTNARP